MGFKLANISGRASLVEDDNYYDLEVISDGEFNSNPSDALQNQNRMKQLNGQLSKMEPTGVINDSELGPPVSSSANCYAVGLNYKNHAEESGLEIPDVPMIFTKHTSCLVGPSATIEMRSDAVDYEAELVAVVGKTGKDIRKEDAWDHVAGLCVGQDISDRGVQFSTKNLPQFNLGKSFDTFGPIGPYLVTTDEVPDPQNLKMWLEVNGKKMQNGSTNTMVYGVNFLVSYLSQFMSLQPGDIISTGTPPGVGMGMNPQVFLKAGDVMKLGIEGLGEQTQKTIQA